MGIKLVLKMTLFLMRLTKSERDMAQRPASNNGMHPTANSADVIENLPLITLRARRVMPGVASIYPVICDEEQSLLSSGCRLRRRLFDVIASCASKLLLFDYTKLAIILLGSILRGGLFRLQVSWLSSGRVGWASRGAC